MAKTVFRETFCIYSSQIDVTSVDTHIKILQSLIDNANLPIKLIKTEYLGKITQKARQQLSEQYQQPIFIIDHKLTLTLLSNQISVAPEWQQLQRRVVSAGRKSELLLQACKLNDQSTALDATAGFGHDSLILASMGANITLLERQPLMALLLLYEQQKMAQQTNWQKLMARLSIVGADASEYLMREYNLKKDGELKIEREASSLFDVIYLDPMFPENSYDHANSTKGAKVGKHMQALHDLAEPPTLQEEETLLSLALANLKEGGRVVVKRPVHAPLLANRKADESWQNDVLRFDGYFKASL